MNLIGNWISDEDNEQNGVWDQLNRENGWMLEGEGESF